MVTLVCSCATVAEYVSCGVNEWTKCGVTGTETTIVFNVASESACQVAHDFQWLCMKSYKIQVGS